MDVNNFYEFALANFTLIGVVKASIFMAIGAAICWYAGKEK